MKINTCYSNEHKTYNVTDPQSATYANVDNMVNDDSCNDWAHRNTILDKDATGIGIANYYDPQTK